MIYVDQLGEEIALSNHPKRIVSLVPSQTELLYDLGLKERVVGITKFCVHPQKWYKSKNRIGGTKKVKIEKIKELQPDLIIGNKEENTKEDIDQLRKIAPVWMSDIYTLEDSLEMIDNLGEVCDVVEKAQEMKALIRANFQSLVPLLKEKISVLYLIWKNPFMAVGSHTFIDHLLSDIMQLDNVLKEKERYPVLKEKELPQPHLVFLSTEPYPFQEKHCREVQQYFPHSKIMLVDGEYFSWYGSRLRDTPKYLQEVIKKIAEK